MKGRGRGRPKKILISHTTTTKSSLPEPVSKFKQSDFGLITHETKQNSDQTLKTEVTNATSDQNAQPESSNSIASKRVVSTRPNRGVNPRYDNETYLGLASNTLVQGNQTEGYDGNPRPFSLLPSVQKGPQTRRQATITTKPQDSRLEDVDRMFRKPEESDESEDLSSDDAQNSKSKKPHKVQYYL